MESDNTLKKITAIIIKTVHPDKIILFGSRAEGSGNDQSDYDICITKSGIDNERVITRAVNRALFDEHVFDPIDLIALETGKWEKNKHNKLMIYHDIFTKGTVLYE